MDLEVMKSWHRLKSAGIEIFGHSASLWSGPQAVLLPVSGDLSLEAPVRIGFQIGGPPAPRICDQGIGPLSLNSP